jgi:phage repressor protein C with HTH and peptisase S24 domain
MEYKIINRLFQYFYYKDIKHTRFEKEIGLSNGYLNTQLKRNADLGESIIKKIIDNCLDINESWLLTGRGAMLKFQEEPPLINESRGDLITIPIVDVSAAAGHGFFNPDYTDRVGEITIPAQMLSKKSGNYYCGHVSGESMEPTLLNKDYIIFKYISPEEWMHIPNDSICFLVDQSGISYVKRIVNRLSSKGYLLCLSDNIDKINYGDFSLYEDNISNIYLVEWKFSNNFSNPSNISSVINEYYYSRLQVLEGRVEILEKKSNST